MFSLALFLAVAFIVDCKQLFPLSQTCNPPIPLCNPPAPICSPTVPLCPPPVPVCAAPVPACPPPVPACPPPVPVCVTPVPAPCPSVAVIEAPTFPVVPFVTDLQNCPDFYFTDILLSPVGSLDPIFSIYGCPELTPAAEPPTPIKALSCCGGPPPGFTEDYSCDCFLKRGCIPPPFI